MPSNAHTVNDISNRGLYTVALSDDLIRDRVSHISEPVTKSVGLALSENKQ